MGEQISGSGVPTGGIRASDVPADDNVWVAARIRGVIYDAGTVF